MKKNTFKRWLAVAFMQTSFAISQSVEDGIQLFILSAN
jgi:hypothetical protein